MKKNILILLSLFVVAVFLIGCSQELTKEEEKALETELEEMSDEELDQIIEDTGLGEDGAIAGQAYSAIKPGMQSQVVQNMALQEKLKRTKDLTEQIMPLNLMSAVDYFETSNACETNDDCSGCAKCFNGVCEKPGCMGPTGDDFEVGMAEIGKTQINGMLSVCKEESCPADYWVIGGGGGGKCCATWDECNVDSDCDSGFCTSHEGVGKFCSSCVSDEKADGYGEWASYMKCHAGKTCVSSKCQ
jgi:hypothetical protein